MCSPIWCGPGGPQCNQAFLNDIPKQVTLQNSMDIDGGSTPKTHQDSFLACIDSCAFWKPLHVLESAWLEHGPFAFWLIHAVRPKLLVELGTHNGFSYLSFCQAVQQLGLSTACFAVDTWIGDDHAGFYGDEVHTRLSTIVSQHYPGFASLLRCRFDEALPYFADGTVDVLHIDGRHGYADVCDDFESWRGKLSASGIVLFHDTNVRERDFGVWRLWSELSGQYPSFEFIHGHGLGILAIGPDVPGPLRHLFEASPAQRDIIRSAYARLGQAIVQQYASEKTDLALAEALSAQARLGAEQHSVAVENERLLAAQQAVTGENERLRAEQQAVIGENERLRAEQQAVAGENERLRAQQQAAVAEHERLRAEQQAAFRESEKLRTAQLASAAENERLRGERGVASAENDRLNVALINSSQSELDARVRALQLEQSTIWRASKRLRRFLGAAPAPLRLQLRRAAKLAWWTLTPHRMPARLAFLRDRRRQQQSHESNQAPSLPGVDAPTRIQNLHQMNYIASASSQFAFGLDTDISEPQYVGKGIVLHVRGWCYSSFGPLRRLELLEGSRVVPVPNHSSARPDVFAHECPVNDHSGYSLLSGFDAFLPFPAIDAPQEVRLTLRATLRGGDIVERPLATVQLLPGYGAIPTPVTWPAEGPRVAICMATYSPPLTLFRAQIKSLQAQTHRNFVCIITDDDSEQDLFNHIRNLLRDDPRFILFRNPKRLNFYLNFQECLRRVPADAEFIALCDQDDVWDPDKLQALLDGFKPEDLLVYSDARLADQTGRVYSETFWSTRRNNYTDLPSLMVANTVTGAASMIRASLLPDILPLPERIGDSYHDHWIGLVALTKASIGYVDRPLYDYVQHSQGVIGHTYADWPGVIAILRPVLRAVPDRSLVARTSTTALKKLLEEHVYTLQKTLLSRTLLLRIPQAAPQKRAILARYTQFETSLRAVFRDTLAARRAARPTLNLEAKLFWSVVGMRLRNLVFRRKRRSLAALQIRSPGARLLDAVVNTAPVAPERVDVEKHAATAEPVDTARRYTMPALEFGLVRVIHNCIFALHPRYFRRPSPARERPAGDHQFRLCVRRLYRDVQPGFAAATGRLSRPPDPA